MKQPERETWTIRREPEPPLHGWALAGGALFLVGVLCCAAWRCWGGAL